VAAPGVAGSIQSVARTATELEAGTTVFISVGSASPPAAGNREQSNYELLVFELAAVPEGGVCTTSDQCDANGLCFVETGAPSGICRITGREGGYCRPEANCDPGYICRGQNETQGTLGTCIREVPAGGDCGGFYTRCVADSSCRSDPTNVGRYLCVGAGVQGGICRRAGAACDSGLMCIGGFCRTQSNAAQPCDPANFRTACVVAGQTCIGIAQPGSGICGPAVPEVEPNNTPSAPMPAPVTFSTVFTGSLAMMDDVDCFRFTVAEGTSIIAETHENNGLCAETTSTILTLHGPDGAPLVTEEDSGNDWCSLIDGPHDLSRNRLWDADGFGDSTGRACRNRMGRVAGRQGGPHGQWPRAFQRGSPWRLAKNSAARNAGGVVVAGRGDLIRGGRGREGPRTTSGRRLGKRGSTACAASPGMRRRYHTAAGAPCRHRRGGQRGRAERVVLGNRGSVGCGAHDVGPGDAAAARLGGDALWCAGCGGRTRQRGGGRVGT
jgi:hypothetical protein